MDTPHFPLTFCTVLRRPPPGARHLDVSSRFSYGVLCTTHIVCIPPRRPLSTFALAFPFLLQSAVFPLHPSRLPPTASRAKQSRVHRRFPRPSRSRRTETGDDRAEAVLRQFRVSTCMAFITASRVAPPVPCSHLHCLARTQEMHAVVGTCKGLASVRILSCARPTERVAVARFSLLTWGIFQRAEENRPGCSWGQRSSFKSRTACTCPRIKQVHAPKLKRTCVGARLRCGTTFFPVAVLRDSLASRCSPFFADMLACIHMHSYLSMHCSRHLRFLSPVVGPEGRAINVRVDSAPEERARCRDWTSVQRERRMHGQQSPATL